MSDSYYNDTVEASFDGGKTWQPARLLSAPTIVQPGTEGYVELDGWLVRWGLIRKPGVVHGES